MKLYGALILAVFLLEEAKCSGTEDANVMRLSLEFPPESSDNPICPGLYEGTPLDHRDDMLPSLARYCALVADLSIRDVMNDIIELLTTSQECWPADDFGLQSTIGQSYGGLFIRLAWHCGGSFRSTDGVGGCAGGRIRFPPESAWPDNVNLDKARALLFPIKAKYGDALSWGDLIVLAGTASILHMGGPVTEVCVGRIDEPDGTNSLPLGPSEVAPGCGSIQGDCRAPIGASRVGLIYVNPEGYLGVPNTEHSAVQIRNVFARMDFNDSETVAVIGGGHAFGKSHGACPAGAGPGPDKQPLFPWPGRCGTGRGEDTAGSGIEGQWTNDPLAWDNEYFKLLMDYGDTYRVQRGPGGAYQWYTPAFPRLMMQTTDLALWFDPAYREIVQEFATNMDSLNRAFAAAWERLMTRGNGQFASTKHCLTPDANFTAAGLTSAQS